MASKKVLELVSSQPTPNQTLVKDWREFLRRAESGEFVGAVTVALRDDGSFVIFKQGFCSDLHLLGAVEYAKFDIMRTNAPRDYVPEDDAS